MFGLDATGIFQQKISDILIILCIIHLGAVMFSFILRWIHPYLKNYATMNNQDQRKNEDNSTSSSVGMNNSLKNKVEGVCSDSGSSDEECFNCGNNLKPFDIQIDDLRQRSGYFDIVNELMYGIGKTTDKKNLIREKIKRMQHSSSTEAQTNISINPKIRVEHPYQTTIYSQLSFAKSLQSNASSDKFESASSGSSDEYYDTDYVPIFHHLNCCDIFSQRNKFQNSSLSKVKKSSKIDCHSIQIEADLISSVLSEDYERNVYQENKILEMAIDEFERELKPIREQIKILKDCLNGFDNCKEPSFKGHQQPLSELSSSISGTILQTEGFSGTLSVCGTNVGPLEEKSSNHNVQVKNSSKTEIHVSIISRPSRLSKTVSNSNLEKKTSFENKQFKNVSESNKNKKRSPLAEMYIQLSKCGSNSASLLINGEQNPTPHILDSGAVTCQIMFNVNVDTTYVNNIDKKNCQNERNIKPLISEPEDILDNPSNTHVSLRPAK